MLNRRELFGLGSLLLAACAAPRDALAVTPSVDDGDDDDLPPAPATPEAGSAACVAAATADNIEGPFYKRGAPSRAVLVTPKDAGERLVVAGRVRSTSCAPIAGAILDVWHADARGGYDLDGFRFRGTLTADAQGRWQLRTIVPGRYLNGRRYRPAHVHVKLRAKGYQPLTTQLYFEGDPYNEGDPFLEPSLVMAHRVVDRVRQARFDFVLAPA